MLKQDVHSKRLLLLNSGQLRIKRLEDVGTAKVIVVVGANELVAAMGLVGETLHSEAATIHKGPEEVLAIRSDDLLQDDLDGSDLVMELLALCSARCRPTNRHIALVFKALGALSQHDHEALRHCHIRCDSQVESGLGHTAKLLRDLETLQGPHEW